MAKATQTVEEALPLEEEIEARTPPELDYKYRMIIVAAQRSKQLQRGARPRVQMEQGKHKSTRIALEEVRLNKVMFEITERKS